MSLENESIIDLDLLEWHGAKLEVLPSEIHIHTSDRIAYKRCRRKWSLASPTRRNLTPTPNEVGANKHLWFGSGIHYALEDYHGWQRYATPQQAFYAYVWATRANLPDEIDELVPLGFGMLAHYITIEKKHPYKTLWLPNADGISQPMVEVNWNVYLGQVPHPMPPHQLCGVYYDGTWDRVVVDDVGRWWIVDYKTAAKVDTLKLDIDPQVTAYCWGAEKIYGIRPAGMIYIQLLKKLANPPRELVDGSLSCNKNQGTTFALFAQEVARRHGTKLANIPRKYVDFLLALKEREAGGDPFIKINEVERTEAAVNNENWKIQSEVAEMLNSDLPLYPNATRDCSWDCSFQGICRAIDDDADFEEIILNAYQKRKDIKSWRTNLPDPQDLQELMRARGLLPSVT